MLEQKEERYNKRINPEGKNICGVFGDRILNPVTFGSMSPEYRDSIFLALTKVLAAVYVSSLILASYSQE